MLFTWSDSSYAEVGAGADGGQRRRLSSEAWRRDGASRDSLKEEVSPEGWGTS